MTEINEDRAPVVVIGVGNALRGDDAVGLAVVDELVTMAQSGDHEHLRNSRVDVVASDGEPTRLLELWRDRRLAIVADAVMTGAAGATLHTFDATTDPLPEPLTHHSSHHAGVAEAVALGRLLGHFPDELTVVGVEPADMTLGRPLSPAVRAVVPALADQVSAIVRSAMVALSPPTLEEGSCT